MLYSLIVALLFVTACLASPSQEELVDQFEQLMIRYGRTYTSEELKPRFAVFQENVQRIEKIRQIDPTAQYELNQFFDMTAEEFQASHMGLKSATPEEVVESCLASGVTNVKTQAFQIPASFDWREHNVVAPVKNQGSCGSCWAFSVVNTIESAWALKTKNLIRMSEQQVVDCSHSCAIAGTVTECNAGCNGGWPWAAYHDIVATGLQREDSYPYTARDGHCAYNKAHVVANITGYTCLSSPNSTAGANEQEMAAFLVQHGPLSIGMNAQWLQFYFGGISDPAICSPKSLNHAVNLVGYGSQNGVDFWIARNSWGASWGESGYFRIARGRGVCGIHNGVSHPKL